MNVLVVIGILIAVVGLILQIAGIVGSPIVNYLLFASIILIGIGVIVRL